MKDAERATARGSAAPAAARPGGLPAGRGARLGRPRGRGRGGHAPAAADRPARPRLPPGGGRRRRPRPWSCWSASAWRPCCSTWSSTRARTAGFDLLTWIRQHHPGPAGDRAVGGPGQLGRDPQGLRAGRELLFRQGQRADGAHLLRPRGPPRRTRHRAARAAIASARLEFDPTRRMVKLGEREVRLTQQQTALVLYLAQGSKPATARDLIEAGLFRSDAAHSTVHSALLTLRRRLDELEPGLGPAFVHASARGYNLVAVHDWRSADVAHPVRVGARRGRSSCAVISTGTPRSASASTRRARGSASGCASSVSS